MNRDKIFNNTYGEQDLSDSKIEFKVAPSYETDLDPDDQMHYNILFKKIVQQRDKLTNYYQLD